MSHGTLFCHEEDHSEQFLYNCSPRKHCEEAFRAMKNFFPKVFFAQKTYITVYSLPLSLLSHFLHTASRPNETSETPNTCASG